ncbi:DUF742 domain-containing protein [Allokutzneria multivorans]|uniref:DUF742 domain-containing protein n=1 Tax=Allokutzneria multivorans TaxID=1142134 RepID=A0ABP7TRT2_9PSEU
MTEGPRLPDSRMIPGLESHDAWSAARRQEPVATGSEDAGDSFVRPFIVTGGRTAPRNGGLRVDTLVRARAGAAESALEFERLSIVRLCAERALSVAEVAVGIGVPLGVARILIADLIAENLLDHQESTALSGHAIERIRDLVRAL